MYSGKIARVAMSKGPRLYMASRGSPRHYFWYETTPSRGRARLCGSSRCHRIPRHRVQPTGHVMRCNGCQLVELRSMSGRLSLSA
jgi:hypothetical protein